VVYGEAGAALLAGAGAYRIGRWLAAAVHRRELIAVPGVAVCVGVLLLQLAAQRGVRTPESRAFNFGGPSFYVGTHAHRGDGVLFMDSFYRKAELGYPGDFRKTSDLALAVPPAVTASYLGANKPFAAVRPLMLSHRRIWVIGYLPSPGLPAGLYHRQVPQRPGHPDLLAGGARRDLALPRQPRRAGGQVPAGPAAPRVELAYQQQEPAGRRRQVPGKLADLRLQPLQRHRPWAVRCPAGSARDTRRTSLFPD
jgi:hypothetical protein